MRLFMQFRFLVTIVACGVLIWCIWPHVKTLALTTTSLPAPSSRPEVSAAPAHTPSHFPLESSGASAKAVLDLAATLPDDFKADVLLRMANATDLAPTVGGEIARNTISEDLAWQAKGLATHAKRRLPGLSNVNELQGGDELHAMQTNGLDQLSLQSRAALVLEKYAPGREVAVLAELPLPGSATCDSEYVDDPSENFLVLGGLWSENVAKRADAVMRRIDAAQHESELMPALQAVAAPSIIDEGHLRHAADTLVRLFSRARGDDASFTTTELGVATQMQLVLNRLDRQPALRDSLHQAYRDYVKDHLQNARCPGDLRGNHWLLEQRYVAELPPEQEVKEVESPSTLVADGDSALNYDAVEVIREAGANIRMKLLGRPSDGAPDVSQNSAGNTFLDQISTGPIAEAAAQDRTGRTQRAQYMELLRYLEYAQLGSARDRGFSLLFPLLSGHHYEQNHDAWFGDLILLARHAQRWPDHAQRLAQMEDGYGPVLKTYALLIRRGQFP